MILVVTNDDGHDAPGLAAMVAAARPLGQVVVVAPAHGMSGCGHQVTTNAPIRVEQPRDSWFVVHGTPADCVRLALTELVPGADWVLSGINPGGNLGADTYISGTVAAAREAALLGTPALAVSHYRKRGAEIDWGWASRWAEIVFRDRIAKGLPTGSFVNVNLPHLEPGSPEPNLVECPVDPNPLQVRFRKDGASFWYDGNYHLRPRVPGGDVDVCFSGHVAASVIRLD